MQSCWSCSAQRWAGLESTRSRVHVTTNMKELRFDADDGVWRVAFAFDTKRQAILLVAGDKSGGGEKRFIVS